MNERTQLGGWLISQTHNHEVHVVVGLAPLNIIRPFTSFPPSLPHHILQYWCTTIGGAHRLFRKICQIRCCCSFKSVTISKQSSIWGHVSLGPGRPTDRQQSRGAATRSAAPTLYVYIVNYNGPRFINFYFYTWALVHWDDRVSQAGRQANPQGVGVWLLFIYQYHSPPGPISLTR